MSTKLKLDDLNKGNIWTVSESELNQMLQQGKKDESFADYETHYMNIINSVFDVVYFSRSDEERLAQLVADAVGVVHRPAVCHDVEGPAQDGGGEHGESPEHHLQELPGGHHVVYDMLKDIGQQQLEDRAQELERDGQSHRALPAPQMAENQTQGDHTFP